MQRFVFAAAAVLAATSAALPPHETERLAKAANVVQDIRSSIPQEYWNRARCVVVVPELKKAAFIVGGEYGKGVMSCRAGDTWSAPVFMQIAKGSWGFQAGAEQVDLVLLVMNEAGVQKLLRNKVTLGADASVAAAPPAASTPPTVRTTTPPTTDDDVRVQLTSMQQMLDRLLASAVPSPVGTTGSAVAPPESGTLVVDRAALMQLRQQLAAALAALNRR